MYPQQFFPGSDSQSPYIPLPPFGYGFVGNSGPRPPSFNSGSGSGSKSFNGQTFRGSHANRNNNGYKG